MAKLPNRVHFAIPIEIPSNGATFQSALYASTLFNGDAGELGNHGGRTSWFVYKPASNGSFTYSGVRCTTLGSSTDIECHAYSGPDNAGYEQELTLLTTAGGDALAGARYSNTIAVTAGTTYYFKVFPWAGQAMNLCLDGTGPASAAYTAFDPAAGATLASAIPMYILTPGGTAVTALSDNRQYGEEVGMPFLYTGTHGRYMWHKYVPVASGTATFGSLGSVYPSTPASTPKGPYSLTDTGVNVFTSALANPTLYSDLTLVATATDDSLLATGNDFRNTSVSMSVVAGTTYYFCVSAFSGYHCIYKGTIVGPQFLPYRAVTNKDLVPLQIKYSDGLWYPVRTRV